VIVTEIGDSIPAPPLVIPGPCGHNSGYIGSVDNGQGEQGRPQPRPSAAQQQVDFVTGVGDGSKHWLSRTVM